MDTSPSHGMRDLRWLLVLAAAFRTLFWLAMPRVLDSADAIHYVENAQHFADLNLAFVDPKIPPLYPLLGAHLHLLVPDLEFALRLVSFFCSILTVVPVYAIALRLHGRRTATLAALTVIVWPWLADYGSRVSTEATAVLLWLCAVWGLLAALEGKKGAAWCSALAFSGLYLCRAEGLFIFLFAFPVVLVAARLTMQSVWRLATPYAVLLVLTSAPYMLYNRALAGAATANYRVGFILEEFDLLRFADTAYKTLFEVLPIMLGPILLLFLGVGLLQSLVERRAPMPTAIVLAFAAAQWFVSLFVLSPAPRYLMAPLLVLMLWSAAGIEQTRAALTLLTTRRWIPYAPHALLLGVMLAYGLVTVGAEHLGRQPREPREYKAAGEWMRENLEPGLLFSRKPQVGYYAGMHSTGPADNDTLDTALQRAAAANARYVVVDERYAPPSLRALLDPAAAPDSLEHLKTFDDYPASRVVVYRLRPVLPQ
ncbi:MAG: glycosyltransferase family 39 protein [Candidatus Hydrogenedentes bacterium]|nr:glycosyltransferase family 39 protein [Candidatus Hydrogenedentota bacterium]